MCTIMYCTHLFIKHHSYVYHLSHFLQKITKLSHQIDEVKGVMMENIDKVLQRGEAFERLVDQTEEIAKSSTYFRKTSRKVKIRTIWKNVLVVGLGVVVVLCIIFAIIWIACRFNFERCRVRKR